VIPAFLLALAALAGAAASPSREVAVTFDDLPTVSVPGGGTAELRAMTEKLVAAITAAKAPVTAFVNEGKLGPPGAPDPERVALLERWVSVGIELGNHTRSHPDLHRISLEDFEADVAAGEATTRALMTARGKKLRYFRHPFLHTGTSLETRRSLEEFLSARGYRIAPVTFDNSEWIFARAYSSALEKGDAALARKVAGAYVPYMEAKIEYFEKESVALFGREIRQVLLVHANQLNADEFGNLARRLRARGYAFTTLDRALEDPAYQTPDTFIGRDLLAHAGLSGPSPLGCVPISSSTCRVKAKMVTGEAHVPPPYEGAAR
jgi:peptidoglycan/xylan/chitin deacetylase (PgdA/CDA1 family)